MSLVLGALRKAYGGAVVVDDVSFEAPSGGLVGVIGPNGAGKSTLFSLITGFLQADAGDVVFEGRAFGAASPQARARAGLARTFQTPREFSNLTVRDNLMAAVPGQSGETLVGALARRGRVAAQEARIGARVDETLALLKLDRVAAQPARGLSGGQKKLVELGRALMTGARMILLDEPFAGVNPVLIGEISDAISALNGRGVGFLIIEHDLKALTRLVSTLHVMDRGRLIASGAPDEALADPRVREAYLGGAPGFGGAP